MYPLSMYYKDHAEAVVFSVEQRRALEAEGFSTVKPAAKPEKAEPPKTAPAPKPAAKPEKAE